MVVERFGGGAPSEGFAGSGVEGMGDGGDVVGVPAGQVCALRKVLAQQAVGRSYVCQVIVGSTEARAADSMTR